MLRDDISGKITDKITSNSSKTAIDDDAAAKTIISMLQFAELRPILEFFANNSDDFIVIIDTAKDYGTYSNGVSFSDDGKFMHIDGKQSNDEDECKEAVRKSLLFGLCQYAIKKVFNNGGKPFAADDELNLNLYCALVMEIIHDEDLLKKIDGTKHLIPHNPIEEILSHIPKLIWQDRSSRNVTRFYPALTDYYHNVFLPAIASYSQKQTLKQDNQPSLFNPASGASLFAGREIPRVKPVAIPVAKPRDGSYSPLAK